MGYEVVMIMKALVVSLVVGAVAGAHHPSSKMVPAMYVFGDSTLDVGNNNYLQGAGVPRANRPYYGVDFPGSKPTGRFSNGYNMADFIAKTLGFERSPMAYLGLKAHNYVIPRALTIGVSYASAGAGILDSTNAGNNIPLSQQVRYFQETKAEMESKVGPHVVGDLLSKSFFLLGVGSNDLFAFSTALARQNRTATQADVAAFVSSLVSNYSTTITELYQLGARKFGIINVGPVGCVPRVRVLSPTGNCSDGLNQIAAGFDGALKTLLANNKLPGMGYSIADSYNLTQVTLGDPMAAGFASSDSACCGTGRLGAQGDCGPTASLCASRDRYIFWDSIHTTQRAAKIGARAFYDGPTSFTTPINFKQLAHN
ncbi:hypothetical protein QOZ80_6BG0504810 [Eleusine coracana subsp. coracana]|nr:hypothetical protein QOZ80_6BG0504810 [Eleusine coracana subsp. coracana]